MADKGKKQKFKYQERDASTWKQKSQESSGSYDDIVKDGIPKFKAQDGKNRIRILPPTWDDADDFGYPILVHYRIGAEEQPYLCLQMKDEECPICEEARRLAADGDVDDSKRFKPSKRKGWWLLDRKSDEPDMPVFWAAPHGTHKDVLLACEDDESGEIMPCDHPQEGYDVAFNKEGAQLRTKYTGVKLVRNATPILEDEDDMAKVLEFIAENPIDSLLKFYDAKYLTAILAGQAPKSDEDEDEEDEKPKKKTKKKPVDEDEEDEKPKGKKRPRLDEDEDEDEKPKGKAKKKGKDEEEEEEPDPDAEEGEEEGEDEALDFDEMDEGDLAKFVKKHRLDIDLDEIDGTKKQRKAVKAAWEEQQEEAKPKAKAKKKPAEDEDEEEEDGNSATAKLKAAAKRAKEKSGKKKADEDEDDD